MTMSPAESSVVREDTNGETHQIVQAGKLCCLRAFSVTYSSGTSSDYDEISSVEYINGDSSGVSIFRYDAPRASKILDLGIHHPTLLIEMPGSGVLFDDGLCIKFHIVGTAVLVSNILYTK